MGRYPARPTSEESMISLERWTRSYPANHWLLHLQQVVFSVSSPFPPVLQVLFAALHCGDLQQAAQQRHTTQGLFVQCLLVCLQHCQRLVWSRS